MTDEQRVDKAAYLLKAITHPLRMQSLPSLIEHKKITVAARQNELSIDQSSHGCLFT